MVQDGESIASNNVQFQTALAGLDATGLARHCTLIRSSLTLGEVGTPELAANGVPVVQSGEARLGEWWAPRSDRAGRAQETDSGNGEQGSARRFITGSFSGGNGGLAEGSVVLLEYEDWILVSAVVPKRKIGMVWREYVEVWTTF